MIINIVNNLLFPYNIFIQLTRNFAWEGKTAVLVSWNRFCLVHEHSLGYKNVIGKALNVLIGRHEIFPFGHIFGFHAKDKYMCFKTSLIVAIEKYYTHLGNDAMTGHYSASNNFFFFLRDFIFKKNFIRKTSIFKTRTIIK